MSREGLVQGENNVIFLEKTKKYQNMCQISTFYGNFRKKIKKLLDNVSRYENNRP